MPKTKKIKKKRQKRIKKKPTTVDDIIKVIKTVDKIKSGSNYQSNQLNNTPAYTNRGGYTNPYLIKTIEQLSADDEKKAYIYKPSVKIEDLGELPVKLSKNTDIKMKQQKQYIEEQYTLNGITNKKLRDNNSTRQKTYGGGSIGVTYTAMQDKKYDWGKLQAKQNKMDEREEKQMADIEEDLGIPEQQPSESKFVNDKEYIADGLSFLSRIKKKIGKNN